MLTALPQTVQEVRDWEWSQFAPFYGELADYDVTAATVETWLAGWSRLSRLMDEHYCRLYLATSVDDGFPFAHEAILFVVVDGFITVRHCTTK